MIERIVGKTGLRVSKVGLGCNNIGWRIDDETSKAVVHKALDVGITLFDTADVYGTTPGRSEEVLGKLLQGKRQDITLVTKFGVRMKGAQGFDRSRRFVLSAVEDSLRRLGTDYIDVYMIHWPDLTTPMEETLRALDDIVTSGRVHYLAVSNLPVWKIVDAQWTAKDRRLHGLTLVQAEYSLLARGAETDLIPACEALGLGLMPYLPLAAGMLSGKYTSGEATKTGRLADNFLGMGDQFLTETNLAKAQKLHDWAQKQGHSLLELAMSWLAAKPIVTGIIAGATTPEQVEQNARAAEWALTPAEIAEIEAI